jgi:hypothetical protein
MESDSGLDRRHCSLAVFLMNASRRCVRMRQEKG